MKTPTHALIGLGLGKLLGGSSREMRWAAIGAALPDLPMMAMYLWCLWLNRAGASTDMRSLVDGYYFGSDAFILTHHLGHAPLPLLAMSALAILAARHRLRLARLWVFGLIGASSHMAVDLFCHAADGALIFWPLDRQTRLDQGFDQWDMAGTGLVIMTLEMVLWLVTALAYALFRAQGAKSAHSGTLARSR